MSATINLKEIVDLPVWEWCKPAPVVSGITGCWAACDTTEFPRIYYYVAKALYRYDLAADGWEQLPTDPFSGTVNTTVPPTVRFKIYGGGGRRVISADSTSITGAFGPGKGITGYKIKITDGPGMGQERTVTSVDDPVVDDYFTVTAVNATVVRLNPYDLGGTNINYYVEDSNKTAAKYTPETFWNYWTGYQLRVIAGAGLGLCRTILCNSTKNGANNVRVNYACQSFQQTNPNYSWGALPPTIPAVGNVAVIESQKAYIDTSWDVLPTSTSVFETCAGSLWAVCPNTAAPWCGFSRYDLLGGYWDIRTQPYSPLINPGVLWTGDISMERVHKSDTPYVDSTATGGTVSTIQDTCQAWTTNQWSGYKAIITGGNDNIGRDRTIYSNDATSLTFGRQLATAIDATNTYEINTDSDKLYLTCPSSAGTFTFALAQYSIDRDIWTLGKIYDYGVVSLGTVTTSRNSVYPIVSASSTAGNIVTITIGAQASTSIVHDIKNGETITVAGIATAGFNGSYTVDQTLSTASQVDPFTVKYTGSAGLVASATFTGTISATVITDNTKNWASNELAGKLLLIDGQPTTTPTLIQSNTSTAMTLTGTGITAPSAWGTGGLGTKYIICEMHPFGCERDALLPNDVTKGGCGVATTVGGTTLTTGTATWGSYVQTTRAWDVDKYIGKYVKVVGGTTLGAERAITDSAANTLTVATLTTGQTNNVSVLAVYADLPGATTPYGVGLLHGYNPSINSMKGKYLYRFRGGATTMNIVDRYNITTDTFDYINHFPPFILETMTTGNMYTYDGDDYIYFHLASTGRIVRYNLVKNVIETCSQIPYSMAGGTVGNKMEIINTEDGLKYLYLLRHAAAEVFRTLLFY